MQRRAAVEIPRRLGRTGVDRVERRVRAVMADDQARGDGDEIEIDLRSTLETA